MGENALQWRVSSSSSWGEGEGEGGRGEGDWEIVSTHVIWRWGRLAEGVRNMLHLSVHKAHRI